MKDPSDNRIELRVMLNREIRPDLQIIECMLDAMDLVRRLDPQASAGDLVYALLHFATQPDISIRNQLAEYLEAAFTSLSASRSPASRIQIVRS